jgi:hypothetical protein
MKRPVKMFLLHAKSYLAILIAEISPLCKKGVFSAFYFWCVAFLVFSLFPCVGTLISEIYFPSIDYSFLNALLKRYYCFESNNIN